MKKLSLVLSLVLALCLCLPAVAEEAAAPSLLAYYTFDDAENLGKDSSVNANDLIRAINPDGIKAVEGVNGGAAYFGGTSGLLAFDDANNDFIDLYTGSALTVSYWAKVDVENTNTEQRRVVDCGVNGSAEGFTNIVAKSVAEDGTVSLFNIAVMGGTDWWSSYGAVDGDVNAWHHFVAVYDNEANTLTTFIDGVKCAEVYAEDEKLAGAFTFCVGGNWAQWDWFNYGNHDATMNGFIGAVDEVKIIAGAVYDMAAIEAMK